AYGEFAAPAPANVDGEAYFPPPSPGGIHTPTRGSASPRSESERPRLHRLVVEYGPLETIEQFVKSGADINVRDQNGNTVLHLLMNDPTLTRPYLPPPTWLRRNAGAVGWR